MIDTRQFLWKIGAPAGYGVLSIGHSMARVAARAGLQSYNYAEYPSLIQGGHNTSEVLMSPGVATTTKHLVDCLVCLTPDTFTLHQHRLHEHSLLVYDPVLPNPEFNAHHIQLPLQDILASLKADKIMINTVALGASTALLGGTLESLTPLITEQFGHKKPEVTEKNIECVTAGYQYIMEHYPTEIIPVLRVLNGPTPEATVLDGNTAFSLGAVAANCKFYAAYPMSPSSSVVEILAGWQEKIGMVVRHAEDEIGVVNEALGASFAGVRAATGTSGGGFALMVESLSYAGIAEIPLVVFLAQRPGPATGMPTWTEQGDLLFAIHAGHGEFPKIILAPGDIGEMISLTKKAFNLAEIYQTPVIVLSDKLLSESVQSITKEHLQLMLAQNPVDTGKTITATDQKPYLRYQHTSDGISPRLIPGVPGSFYQANSYEHLQDSHTTEEAVERTAQVNKRAKKEETYLTKDFEVPTVYGNLTTSDTVLVCWGAVKGAAFAAQQLLAVQGVSVAIIHFTHVFPLDPARVAQLFAEHKRYILVENNSTGQLGQVLKQTIGIDFREKLLKYDGRPIFTEEIIGAVQKRSGK